MWRDKTIDSRIARFIENKKELENNLVELFGNNTKKFNAEAADYILWCAMHNSESDLRYMRDTWNLTDDIALLNGNSIPFPYIVRLKGILIAINEIKNVVNIDKKSLLEILSDVITELHADNKLIDSIGMHDMFYDIISKIALGLFDNMNKPSIKQVFTNETMLSLLVSFASYNKIDTFNYIENDNPYPFSSIEIVTKDEGLLNNFKSLKSVLKVYTENGIAFIPNKKYFFVNNLMHRKSIFADFMVITEIIHKNTLKFKEESNENDNL